MREEFIINKAIMKNLSNVSKLLDTKYRYHARVQKFSQDFAPSMVI